MNFFERFIILLQTDMDTPVPYGWFHWLWILLVVIALIIFYKFRDKYSEKQLKIVLGTYGITAFVLELLKQISWSFEYDSLLNVATWDYSWYSAPFQLCTTPIFVSIICLFLKKESKVRNALLSYLAFITIWGGLTTILIPDSCFTSDILVNIHTMFLHCGSFVVSIYLLINKVVKIDAKSLMHAFYTFLGFATIAEVMNIVIYNSGILNGETFNMFYISPYFISVLPVFSTIQENVPFLLFLLTYIFVIFIGALVVYYSTLGLMKLGKKKSDKELV